MATLTVADYVLRMKQAIGNQNPSTGFTLLDVLNETVRYLFDYADWSWRYRPPTYCSLVNAQEYCTLPSDFGANGELLSVHSIWSPVTFVNKVSLPDIARMRGQPIQNHLNYYVAVAYPTQGSQLVRPGTPRLEIWPTPGADVSNAFRITYKAGAIELTDNAHVPNIPSSYEQALTHLARARAMVYETGADNPKATAELVLAKDDLNRLMESDGMQESDSGVMSGGAAQMYRNPKRNDYLRPFSTFPTR